MKARRGSFLLVALLLIHLACLQGRRVFFQPEGPPSFFLDQRPGIFVELGEGFPRPGVHQFSDGTTPEDVIKLTGLKSSALAVGSDLPLRPGEVLVLSGADSKDIEFKRFFMTSGQRMALGIPLHPDRMTQADWETLSGIGPKLAQAIEEDRQKNGDFGTLAGLERVRGVGPGRLKAWEKFFH